MSFLPHVVGRAGHRTKSSRACVRGFVYVRGGHPYAKRCSQPHGGSVCHPARVVGGAQHDTMKCIVSVFMSAFLHEWRGRVAIASST